jgi:PAS domain S-box-containing protein
MVEAPLDSLLELAPDAMLALDRDGRVVAANERAAELFGYRLDDFLARPGRLLLGLPAAGAGVAECTGRHRDGTEIAVEVSFAPLDVPDGPLWVAAVRDIRQRVQNESSLRQASERFQRVFEDGPIAMALVGDDHRLVEVNDAFCALTGYSAGELAALTFTDITHPDDQDTDLWLARKVFAGELPGYSLDKRYVKKNGEVIWISLTVSVIRDELGRPLKGLGLVQDITQRRQELAHAQSALEGLARDRDRILEFAGEGIYHSDERGRITFANPAAAEMLGWPPEDLIGKPAHELFHHTRADGTHHPREQCAIHGPTVAETVESPIDDVFWRRDGTQFPVHYRSTAVRGAGSGGAVVVFWDLSERVGMEKALRDAGARAARERMKAAEAERARWARELHDETLQGLAALHVLLSGARSRTVQQMGEHIREAQEQIEHEMEKLRGLISDLRPAALDQLGLEASVGDLADRTVAVYGIQVETELDLRGPDGAPCRLDPEVETTAYRIVQECLSNAARHADASRVVVQIGQRDGHLSVRVEDDGQGFEPAGDTAGFGLRGMRERIDLLQGRLTIDSAGGRGTQISAALPLDA